VLLWLHRRENNLVINGTLKLIIESALPGIVTVAAWAKFQPTIDIAGASAVEAGITKNQEMLYTLRPSI
jgi:hypothetical protein